MGSRDSPSVFQVAGITSTGHSIQPFAQSILIGFVCETTLYVVGFFHCAIMFILSEFQVLEHLIPREVRVGQAVMVAVVLTEAV